MQAKTSKLALWCLLIFAFTPLSTNATESLTFFQLDDMAAKKVNAREVQIRGFLYKMDDTHLILASEPNLKSCCVGSPAKCKRQILVFGDIPPQHAGIAVTLKGEFSFDPDREFPAHLNNATLVH